MSNTYVTSIKCCGTCENWEGLRAAPRDGSAAIVASSTTRGKCHLDISYGVVEGTSTCDGFHCSKYQKWSALK